MSNDRQWADASLGRLNEEAEVKVSEWKKSCPPLLSFPVRSLLGSFGESFGLYAEVSVLL